jgi:hypothetical protein
MRTTKPVMLTISFAAIEAARAAAGREDRSLSNYTSVLYELAGRVRLADIERLAATASLPDGAPVQSGAAVRRVREPKRAEAR